MRPSIYLALLPLPLLGCLDAGTSGRVDLQDDSNRGQLVLRVHVGDLYGVDSGLVDIAVGPVTSDAGWTRARVPWVYSEGPAQLVVPCDARDAPYRAEAHVVGLYRGTLDSAGGVFGEPAPEGLAYVHQGTSPAVTTCVAGEDTVVNLLAPILRPSSQGSFDIAVNASDEEVGDAVWRLRVENGESPPRTVWEKDLPSSVHGDGHGTLSYVGPCDSAPGMEDSHVSVDLVGLFAGEQTPRLAPSSPSEPLDVWSPPTLTATARCRENNNVFVQFDEVVARVIRADDRVQARFAGLTCSAGWLYSEHGGPLIPRFLSVGCETEHPAPPVLHFDDLTFRCEGADPLTLPIGDRVVTTLQTPDDGPLAAGWLIFPERERMPSGRCTMEVRATVLQADATLEGDTPALYPELRWTVPTSDDGRPIETSLHLDTHGPITVGYVRENTLYDHAVVAEPQPEPEPPPFRIP